jgi:hypothetical protein
LDADSIDGRKSILKTTDQSAGEQKWPERLRSQGDAVLTIVIVLLSTGSLAWAESGADRLDQALKTTDFIRDNAHDEFAKPRKTNFDLPKGKVNQKEVAQIVALLKVPKKVESGTKTDAWEQLRIKHGTGITVLRGGGDSDNPLGFYHDYAHLHYDSKYKDVSNENVAFWAYDLHRFLNQNRSWYGNFRDSVYMHYADKERFAKEWWQALDKSFATLSPAEQSAWVHDALEDGIVVYWYYEAQSQAIVHGRQKDWLGWEIRGIEKRD